MFHQTGEDGGPALDWGHVFECLNKLDAGVPERLLLLSRDEASMLVASFADIKRCAAAAYAELEMAAAHARTQAQIAAAAAGQQPGHQTQQF